MITIEQVFLPLDLSSSSRAALAMAQSLSDPPPRLQLAHVLEGWTPTMRRVLFPFAAMGEDEVQFEHALTQEAGAALQQHLDIARFDDERWLSAPLIRMGNPKEEIAALLRAQPCDLIVMGACGEHGVAPETLGSIARCVLRHATQPVLLTRDHTRRPKLRHILCAVDLSTRSHEVVSAALGLAISTGSSLELMHVLADPLGDDPHHMLRGQVKFNPQQVLDRSRDKLDALFERAIDAVAVPFEHKKRAAHLLRQRHVIVGDVSRALLERADATDADLIVVGSRDLQRTPAPAMGRVCWAVAHRSTSHVLVVPIEAAASAQEAEG